MRVVVWWFAEGGCARVPGRRPSPRASPAHIAPLVRAPLRFAKGAVLHRWRGSLFGVVLAVRCAMEGVGLRGSGCWDVIDTLFDTLLKFEVAQNRGVLAYC